jgi:hypothetical protein
VRLDGGAAIPRGRPRLINRAWCQSCSDGRDSRAVVSLPSGRDDVGATLLRACPGLIGACPYRTLIFELDHRHRSRRCEGGIRGDSGTPCRDRDGSGARRASEMDRPPGDQWRARASPRLGSVGRRPSEGLAARSPMHFDTEPQLARSDEPNRGEHERVELCRDGQAGVGRCWGGLVEVA